MSSMICSFGDKWLVSAIGWYAQLPAYGLLVAELVVVVFQSVTVCDENGVVECDIRTAPVALAMSKHKGLLASEVHVVPWEKVFDAILDHVDDQEECNASEYISVHDGLLYQLVHAFGRQLEVQFKVFIRVAWKLRLRFLHFLTEARTRSAFRMLAVKTFHGLSADHAVVREAFGHIFGKHRVTSGPHASLPRRCCRGDRVDALALRIANMAISLGCVVHPLLIILFLR
jgi:hypothetical protein